MGLRAKRIGNATLHLHRVWTISSHASISAPTVPSSRNMWENKARIDARVEDSRFLKGEDVGWVVVFLRSSRCC